MKTIILASKSPRRKELLEKCGIPFTCDPANIDETLKTDLSIPDAIQELSCRKAGAVLERHPHCIVIGSDTAVTIDHEVLGKPVNREHAFEMLKKLQGRTHQVVTGLCVKSEFRMYQNVSVSDVTIAPMTDEEINQYIDTGECDDKAGAYGIQGYGGRYITHISGDFYAIMGLPLNMLYEELKNISLY